MGSRTTLAALVLGATLMGCAFDPVARPEQDTLRVLTFNSGLAPGDVPHADERAPAVAAALAASDADVLCLQELWRDADYEAVRAAAARHPFAARRAAEPAESVGCAREELGPVRGCAEASCPGLAGGELADCALRSCDAQVAAVSGSCVNCMLGVISGGGGIAEIDAGCAVEGGGGAGFLYDGAFDVALLTSLPVVAEGSLALDASVVRASVQHVQVESPLGPVHVFCTHLASPLDSLGPYPGELGSWEQEQEHQIEQVLAFVEERAGGAGPVVLTGDLNTGPGVPAAGIAPVRPGLYARFAAAGFESPFVEQPEAACTYCGSPPELIDHVLVRGLDAARSAARRWVDPIRITVAGDSLETPLSDHVGLELTLSRPRGEAP